MCISCRINNIDIYANPANNSAREMRFGSPDGGADSEYNGVRLVESLNICDGGYTFLYSETI